MTVVTLVLLMISVAEDVGILDKNAKDEID